MKSMERQTFKILFFIKQSRIDRNGESPIRVRVTVNGERAESSTNYSVKPKLWHIGLGKSLGTDMISQELNNGLDVIKVRLMQMKRELEIDGEEITAQKIIQKYLGKDEKPKMTLLTVFHEHNERCIKLAEKGDMAPDAEKHLRLMNEFQQYSLSEHQFAQFLGKSRMYQCLPANEKRLLPSLEMTDSQINMIARNYYQDDHFARVQGADSISMWRVYNLLTGANKSSYIDNFLDRSLSASQLSEGLNKAIQGDNEYKWFIN